MFYFVYFYFDQIGFLWLLPFIVLCAPDLLFSPFLTSIFPFRCFRLLQNFFLLLPAAVLFAHRWLSFFRLLCRFRKLTNSFDPNTTLSAGSNYFASYHFIRGFFAPWSQLNCFPFMIWSLSLQLQSFSCSVEQLFSIVFFALTVETHFYVVARSLFPHFIFGSFRSVFCSF